MFSNKYIHLCIIAANQSIRIRYFMVLRRLEVFEYVLMNDMPSLARNVYRIFDRIRKCDRDMALGLWQAIPPAVFLRSFSFL